MSKKKERKAAQQAVQEARKITPGKLLRLILKTFLFAVVVSLILLLLSMLNVPALDNWFIQVGVMFVLYLLAFPFIMREFRPGHYRKK